VLVALLIGLFRAFGEKERASTHEIIDALLADDAYDWSIANHGKPINEAWLRERLRGVIAVGPNNEPGSERWGSGNNKVRGYTRGRFDEAWGRYTPYLFSPKQPAQAAHPANDLRSNGKSRDGWGGQGHMHAAQTVRMGRLHPAQNSAHGPRKSQ
jgi:hypothetical protein